MKARKLGAKATGQQKARRGDKPVASEKTTMQRSTSTHRVGLFFHMHLVMIWHKTLYPSNKQDYMRIFDVYMGWTKCTLHSG